MTPEQEERFRARLRALTSLREVYRLIEDLDAFERAAPQPLPFFVIRSILQELAWRLEGLPVDGRFMERVAGIQQILVPAIERVLEARDGAQADRLLQELTVLCGQWILLRPQLT